MKKLLNRIFVVGAVCLLCLHSGQGSVLDQSQPIFNNNVGGYFNGGSSRQKIAQVVTPGISGWLTTVAAPVTGLGTLRLEIRGVSAGLPNDTQLASQNIAGSSLPSFFSDPTGFRQLNLSVPPLVSAGEPFAIVLSALNPPMGSLTVLSGPPGDPYAGGDAFYDSLPNPPDWIHRGDFGSFDIPFQTYVEPIPEPATTFTLAVLSLLVGALASRKTGCGSRNAFPGNKSKSKAVMRGFRSKSLIRSDRLQ
jgi:hypothetical protein